MNGDSNGIAETYKEMVIEAIVRFIKAKIEVTGNLVAIDTLAQLCKEIEGLSKKDIVTINGLHR